MRFLFFVSDKTIINIDCVVLIVLVWQTSKTFTESGFLVLKFLLKLCFVLFGKTSGNPQLLCFLDVKTSIVELEIVKRRKCYDLRLVSLPIH